MSEDQKVSEILEELYWEGDDCHFITKSGRHIILKEASIEEECSVGEPVTMGEGGAFIEDGANVRVRYDTEDGHACHAAREVGEDDHE